MRTTRDSNPGAAITRSCTTGPLSFSGEAGPKADAAPSARPFSETVALGGTTLKIDRTLGATRGGLHLRIGHSVRRFSSSSISTVSSSASGVTTTSRWRER